MFGFGSKLEWLAVAVLVAGTGVSAAQERLITVTGNGSVEVTPDLAIATFSVSGSGETVVAALGEFQRNRQRIEDTLNPMDYPGVSLEFKGKSIGDSQTSQMQIMMFGDGVQETASGASSISEGFLVKLNVGELGMTEARLAELTRIIDAAVAAKAQPGMVQSDFYNPSMMMAGIVTVTTSKTQDAEREATRAAFEDARRKAAFLASLSGVELGDVHSVDLEPTGTDPGLPGGTVFGNPPESALAGSKIRIQSTLVVRFSIRPRIPE